MGLIPAALPCFLKRDKLNLTQLWCEGLDAVKLLAQSAHELTTKPHPEVLGSTTVTAKKFVRIIILRHLGIQKINGKFF